MKNLSRLLPIIFLFILLSCKKDDASETAFGVIFLNNAPIEIINGSLKTSGNRYSLTLNTRGVPNFIIDFDSDSVKTHILTNTNIPQVSYINDRGELYESFEGFLQITKFEKNENENIEIEGLFECRIQSGLTGTMKLINNANFRFSRTQNN